MLKRLLVVLAAAALTAPAVAHSHKTKGLEIVHPWTRASPTQATTVRVFMTIRNGSGRPDRLVSAATSRADRVELHDAGKGAAVFAVAKGKDLALHGDGPSLVLTGVKAPFVAY